MDLSGQADYLFELVEVCYQAVRFRLFIPQSLVCRTQADGVARVQNRAESRPTSQRQPLLQLGTDVNDFPGREARL